MIYIVGDICLLKDAWCKALILQRAIGIVSTIATMIGFWLIKNRAVMCKYNGVHITITYLNCVSFKSFVE